MRNFANIVRAKNPGGFIEFCEEIEAQIIALKQAGVADPMVEYEDLFTRSALRALPKGGEGDYIQTKIRLEGEDWSWKEMERMMNEPLELSEEHGPTGMYVPKGKSNKDGL